MHDAEMTIPIKELLDRVASMPLIEAEEELLLRRESLRLELNMLTHTRAEILERTGSKKGVEGNAVGLAIYIVSTDIDLLKEALARLRNRMNRLEWGNAVRAIYGDEGILQCKIWMIQNDENPGRDHEIDKLLASRGLTRIPKDD